MAGNYIPRRCPPHERKCNYSTPSQLTHGILWHTKIIAAVRVKILSKSSLAENNLNKIPPLYAGQPIAAVLSIRTSFHWGPGSELSKKDKTYVMRFDVEELLKDWLVSGQKRGDFVAKVCEAVISG